MDDDRSRRQFLLASGALGASALLAGCTDGGAGAPGTDATTAADTDTGTATSSTESATEEATGGTSEPTEADDGPYSVTMEPVGTVEFEAVPETWVANNGSWADMGAALGLEPPEALWLTGRYHTKYYEAIPGVSVDKSDMTSLSDDGVDKELFYELDADLHVIDPNFLVNRFDGWAQADVDEVRESVAPFFANSIFSRGYPWHEDYRYYTLLEAFEKLAQVFGRTDRYEAFASLHEEFRSTVRSNLPPESERPSVAVFWASGDEPEAFYPYVIGEGTSFKQWRDLGVNDALAETSVKDFYSSRGQIGYETLLDVDPEVVLLRGQEAKTAEEFEDTVVAFMEDHPVGSDLTAVQEGRVFRGGGLYQGPITNLVLTERAANQLYPDAFADVTLYDPQRVAAIVDGEF
jgi:iron complex transport system substrate-binding protein